MNLTIPKWMEVMDNLICYEDMVLMELSKKLHQHYPNTVELINHLEKKGLVYRTLIKSKQNRRLITLTEKGKEIAILCQNMITKLK